MANKYYVTNFYRFTAIASVEQIQSDLTTNALKDSDTRGLIILAPEGLNGTMEFTSPETRGAFKDFLKKLLKLTDHDFKDSESDRKLLRHFKIKVRPEIVTIGAPELVPAGTNETHLSPEQWNEWLKSGRKFHLVDSRNDYEYRVGHFKGAVDPKIEQFTDFPDAVEKNLQIPKDEPLLMYCTGGIRCEKAVLEMRRRGYQQVYQLHGGILKYLEEFPNDQFEGECFIFDDRVALKQDLSPTQTYSLCPHCSDPAQTAITCSRCGGQTKVCAECATHDIEGKTCSKECAHHYRLKPWQRARRVFSPDWGTNKSRKAPG